MGLSPPPQSPAPWHGGLVFLLLALACAPVDEKETYVPETDADQDGVSPGEGDCDDGDATVFPGQRETWYDGIDQDCDGNDDDQDGDGAAVGSDCDDVDPTVLPGGTELCDGRDNDCDGTVDDDPADGLLLYTDTDRDGLGAGGALWSACAPVDGTSTVLGDCDDLDPTSFPGGTEVCDGRDNDCNGVVDDSPSDGIEYFPDADGDGYGELDLGEPRCELGEGWVESSNDCDDADALVFPGAEELCDLEDNDCDGTIDGATVGDRTYFADLDGDGHGDAASTVENCGLPAGYSELADDCDDGDASRAPSLSETCDEVDNDCDGAVDEDPVDGATWYADADADGHGSDEGEVACAQPEGTLATGGDCDDDAAAVYPGTTETCDDRDNDCDGATDEPDALDAVTFYYDADLDGYGVAAPTTPACREPRGYAPTADDCDDTDSTVNPGRSERCDGRDNDCDGVADEEAIDAPTWYGDGDGDGHGAGEGAQSCEGEAGQALLGDDCDDGDLAVSPSAAEADNGADDDCDVLVDEDFLAEGDLVVTEIARQPYTGGSGTSTNYYAQWIEVYNASARVLALDGWYLGDIAGNGTFVPPEAALRLDPGAYAVLCYDDLAFATPSTCDYTWADPAWGEGLHDTTLYLDRDDDLVMLYAGTERIDEVHWTYDDASGYWPRTATYSMELDDGAYDSALNDDENYWCIADSSDIWSDDSLVGHPDHGTPGSANGGCP
ncbi:MAG: lamin tail domain-containing protein [Deltaproteobacteria bacterium]|nr:lamin tail domain-containing protein [Deltaproteobacteria bacterium]